MTIKDALLDIFENYLRERQQKISKNPLANRIRNSYSACFDSILREYGDRYIVYGSTGQGNWADCPWIGIFDTLKTKSAQEGYYLVYLFDKTLSRVYLSLNQGVTIVTKEYKRSAKEVLAVRAEDFRCKIRFVSSDKIDLTLNSNLSIPKLYETGNILATSYSISHIPDEQIIEQDFRRFLGYYQDLIVSDSSEVIYANNTITEIKKRRLHEKFDRRGDISLAVKKKKGYKCEVCDFCFTDKYGDLGQGYIEAHHLSPFSLLDEGKTSLNLEKDFAVLCSNCHRMIHRMKDPSNLKGLREIVLKIEE